MRRRGLQTIAIALAIFRAEAQRLCPIVFLTLALATPVAAQRTVNVTVHSDPQSASLSQSGAVFGLTPFALKYKTTKEFTSGKACLALLPLTVRWASGAVAQMSNLTVCPVPGQKRQASKYELTFVRPDIPGREIDANFDLQVKRDASAEAYRDAQQFQALVDSLRKPKRVEVQCTSSAVGTTVYTTCR